MEYLIGFAGLAVFTYWCTRWAKWELPIYPRYWDIEGEALTYDQRVAELKKEVK